MGHTRMARLTTIGIVLLTLYFSRSRASFQEIGWKSIERTTRSSEVADESIREVFRRISSGISTRKDDEELVNLIKKEIVRTAYKIKTPEGSIEAAARRAQKLVSELTSAYTTAIYKSKSAEDARTNFNRFQSTVQMIVDFIKDGQFVK